jgi:integrase
MRRANGEGSIYKLKDGRWRVSVSVRLLGRLHRISRTRRKRADCVALLDDLRAKIGASDEIVKASGTLATYLDTWLATAVQPHLAINTAASYKHHVKKHISPRIGSARLNKLSPLHIEEFKAAMISDKVKSRAAQAAFQVLRTALAYAVYPLRLLLSNPCDGLKAPVHRKRKMLPFEAREVKMILENTADTRWHAVYAVAFGCGLRWGEIFALTTDDLDWAGSLIDVNKQLICCGGHTSVTKPKSKSSIRLVKMPAFVKAALRRHRAIQIANGYAGNILFPTLSGKHLCRSNFTSDEWKIRLSLCGLEHRGFHHTRHTYATLSLSEKTDVAVVSKSLGHSSPLITMSVYAHVLKSAEGEAADAMQRLLG